MEDKIYGGIKWTWIEDQKSKNIVAKDIETLTNELSRIGQNTCFTFQGIKQDEKEPSLSFKIDKNLNNLDLKHQGRMLKIYWRKEE